MAITYSETITDWYQLGDRLWSGALDRWKDATPEQCEAVYQRLEEWFDGTIPTITQINDVIWFDCDDIFYPEEEEEEEEETIDE